MKEAKTEAAACSSCGRPLAPEASFCRHCGARKAAAPPPAPAAPPPPQPDPAPAGRRRGAGRVLLVALLSGLLVGGGVAAAFLLLGKEDPATPTVAPGTAATVPASESAPTASGEASSDGNSAGFPGADRAQMAREIEAVLLAFHEDVVDERFRDAWSLLSARKRSQALREDGYAKWAEAQTYFVPYLSPGGITVRLDALEGEGVARVQVSGMGWSKPGAPCSEWSGLTWAKFEAGTWTYDPGYSTTPQREREWKPREKQLLGATCL